MFGFHGIEDDLDSLNNFYLLVPFLFEKGIVICQTIDIKI